MEPRHRVPEFQSEFELDYTDNAIYLILKRERIQLVDVGPQVTTARTTIQLCTDCMLTSNLFRNSLGERQTFLSGVSGKRWRQKICLLKLQKW